MRDPDDTTEALDFILGKLDGVKRRGQMYDARCPAHEDHRASLTVARGDMQPVIFHCHAGCEPPAILDALGVGPEAVSQRRADPEDRWVAVYDYTDEEGRILFQVCRSATKEFRQRVPDPAAPGGAPWKLGEVRRVLYRLPRVLDAIGQGIAVWLVEGEKDVHALEARGKVATTCPGGAGKWRPEYTETLRDAQVHIVADADPPGQKHAREVYAALLPAAANVHVLEPKAGKDTTDHLAAGHSLRDFLTTSPGEPKPELAISLKELLAMDFPAEDWVVPGLLERGDSLVWTGREGAGKSQVLRQMAVCAGAGLHPFTGTIHPPRTVLVVDCENSWRRNHRLYRDLAGVVERRRLIPEGGIRLEQHPEGINLASADQAEWLAERVRAHKPDLLIIGPFYKLHMLDANEETAARMVVAAIDRARYEADCALVLEAHAPHGRELRPIGSSLLCRWPDFGMGIQWSTFTTGRGTDREIHRNRKLVTVDAWRGPRDDRDWPLSLRWGNTARGEFPWMPGDQEQETLARLEPEPDPGWLATDRAVEQAAMTDLRDAGLLPEGED